MLVSLAKRALSIPVVFETYQSLVGAPECHRCFIAKHVRPKRGDVVLDVGCGTGASVALLPQPLAYTGIDISRSYISRAQARHGDLGRFVVGDVTASAQELNGPYDLAFAFGVLHHLSDEEVTGLIGTLQ